MKQRQQVAVGGAIFNRNEEILFVKRGTNDEFLPGVWEIPGGGSEFGERPEEALQREIREECGIEIRVGAPIIVSDYYLERNDERVQRVEITFICELLSEPQEIILSDEHESFVWKNWTNLYDLEMTDYMEKIVIAVKNFRQKNSNN